MSSNILELRAQAAWVSPMRRIVRAYRNKIRRHLDKGSTFSFWHAIGNLDYDELRAYVERHFQKGMTWRNYGEWQMMHTKPGMPMSTVKDFYRYVHYNNYRPAWKNRETKLILRKRAA
jgi:hypothetical protein